MKIMMMMIMQMMMIMTMMMMVTMVFQVTAFNVTGLQPDTKYKVQVKNYIKNSFHEDALSHWKIVVMKMKTLNRHNHEQKHEQMIHKFRTV